MDVCLKRPKINEKEVGVGPFKKTETQPLPIKTYFFVFDILLFGRKARRLLRNILSTF